MKLLNSGIAVAGRKAQDLVCKIVIYCHALPSHTHATQQHHFAHCEICLSWHTQCRKEETRNVEGVPLLKRGSRGKGAAIPIQAITAAAARSARQGQSLRLQIVALQILGLKQVHLHNWSLRIRTDTNVLYATYGQPCTSCLTNASALQQSCSSISGLSCSWHSWAAHSWNDCDGQACKARENFLPSVHANGGLSCPIQHVLV